MTKYMFRDNHDELWAAHADEIVHQNREREAAARWEYERKHQIAMLDNHPDFPYALSLIEAACDYYELTPYELLASRTTTAHSDKRQLLGAILERTSSFSKKERAVVLGYKSNGPDTVDYEYLFKPDGVGSWGFSRSDEKTIDEMVEILDRVDREVSPKVEFTQPLGLTGSQRSALSDFWSSQYR